MRKPIKVQKGKEEVLDATESHVRAGSPALGKGQRLKYEFSGELLHDGHEQRTTRMRSKCLGESRIAVCIL